MTFIQPGDKVLVGESKHEYRVIAVDPTHETYDTVTVARTDGKRDGCRVVPRDWCRRVRPTLIEAVGAAHKESA